MILRDGNNRDAVDSVAERLHLDSVDLIRARKFDDFAAMLHPLELARIKAFYLTLMDAAASEPSAQECLAIIDRQLARRSVVEADAIEIAAALFAQAFDPDGDLDHSTDLTDLFSYVGVVPEGNDILHVLYSCGWSISLATYLQHQGEWKMRLPGNLSQWSSLIQNQIRSQDASRTTSEAIAALADVNITEVELVGGVIQEPWAFIVSRYQITWPGFEFIKDGVAKICSLQPEWELLEQPIKLAEAIRARWEAEIRPQIQSLLQHGSNIA